MQTCCIVMYALHPFYHQFLAQFGKQGSGSSTLCLSAYPSDASPLILACTGVVEVM